MTGPTSCSCRTSWWTRPRACVHSTDGCSPGSGACTREARSSMLPAEAHWCLPKPGCSTGSRRRRTGAMRRSSARISQCRSACGPHSGAGRPRPQHGLLRRRVILAGSRALLIVQYGGTEEAIRMSKLFLYQWHRDGQLPYASMIRMSIMATPSSCAARPGSHRTTSVADIVAELVRQSGSTQAHVRPPLPGGDRLFAARLHPGSAHRGGKAILETSAVPVDAVGREVGYEDIASFRRLFRRLAGMHARRLPPQVPDACLRRSQQKGAPLAPSAKATPRELHVIRSRWRAAPLGRCSRPGSNVREQCAKTAAAPRFRRFRQRRHAVRAAAARRVPPYQS